MHYGFHPERRGDDYVYANLWLSKTKLDDVYLQNTLLQKWLRQNLRNAWLHRTIAYKNKLRFFIVYRCHPQSHYRDGFCVISRMGFKSILHTFVTQDIMFFLRSQNQVFYITRIIHHWQEPLAEDMCRTLCERNMIGHILQIALITLGDCPEMCSEWTCWKETTSSRIVFTKFHIRVLSRGTSRILFQTC